MLLNIGFTYAKKYHCDYVVFHDVDMLPIDVDYSYTENVTHLATNFQNEDDEINRETFDTYFGGVTMFPIEAFKAINGYSNKYWGWGFEDDDLFLRCRLNGINLQTKKIRNIGKNTQLLKFNGNDAYVKVKNTIDLNSNFSILITFEPSELKLNHTKQSDEFSIFSIPGYDFAISYTSFNRYNFCVFDNTNKAIYLNSEIKPTYKTNIILTYDCLSKTIKMYQDGVLIGETEEIKRFHRDYKKSEYFYIGVGNPTRDIIPNWFKGTFENFAYYDSILTETEIIEIVNNKTHLLTENFGDYKSANKLKIYYDSEYIKGYKLTDLSGNLNMGEIINCEIIESKIIDSFEIHIPHRRKSLFKSLKHEENGFNGNRWKDDNTRWNQLRFINEVTENPELIKYDGLSSLQFNVHGIERINKNIEIINVGI
jgi:hypothetical protein